MTSDTIPEGVDPRDVIASLRQELQAERTRREHAEARERDWCAQWFHLVHELCFQNGGSFTVFHMSEAERETRVGGHLATQFLHHVNATRYRFVKGEG